MYYQVVDDTLLFSSVRIGPYDTTTKPDKSKFNKVKWLGPCLYACSSDNVVDGFYGEQFTNLFKGFDNIIEADLSFGDITVDCNGMFMDCTSLVKVVCKNITGDCSDMFNGCTSLSDINIGYIGLNWAKSKCDRMFKGCSSITKFDYDKIFCKSMESMFENCSNLSGSVDLYISVAYYTTYVFGDNAVIAGVANLKNMFSGCTSITSANCYIMGKDVVGSYGTNCYCDGMFKGCTSLETFKGELCGSGANLFNGCSALRSIYSFNEMNFGGSDMFKGCTSLVGGNGTTYDPEKVGADMAKVDGYNGNIGYFTYTTDKDLRTVNVYHFNYLKGNVPYELSHVKVLSNHLVVPDGSSMKLSSRNFLSRTNCWIIIGKNDNKRTVLTGDIALFPVENQNYDVYYVDSLGEINTDLNAIIKAVANPQ